TDLADFCSGTGTQSAAINSTNDKRWGRSFVGSHRHVGRQTVCAGQGAKPACAVVSWLYKPSSQSNRAKAASCPKKHFRETNKAHTAEKSIVTARNPATGTVHPALRRARSSTAPPS